MERKPGPTFEYSPPEADARAWRATRVLETARLWLFSVLGLIVAWVLAIGIVSITFLLIVMLLHESVSLPLLFVAMWWLAGIVLAHWWIPVGRRVNARTEGIAAAGWHIAGSLWLTAAVSWITLFDQGIHTFFTASDTWPVIIAAILFTVGFGIGIIWLRGHDIADTLRYGIIAGTLGAVWMAAGWFVSQSSIV